MLYFSSCTIPADIYPSKGMHHPDVLYGRFRGQFFPGITTLTNFMWLFIEFQLQEGVYLLEIMLDVAYYSFFTDIDFHGNKFDTILHLFQLYMSELRQ